MWMWAQIERARKFFYITIFHLLFVLTWQHYSENAADKGILMQYVCSVHTSSSPRGGTGRNLLNVLHAGCKHRQYKPISYSVLYAMLTYHGNRIFFAILIWSEVRLPVSPMLRAGLCRHQHQWSRRQCFPGKVCSSWVPFGMQLLSVLSQRRYRAVSLVSRLLLIYTF